MRSCGKIQFDMVLVSVGNFDEIKVSQVTALFNQNIHTTRSLKGRNTANTFAVLI